MNNEQTIQKIQAVINTLGAMTLRADQVDAFQRVNVCTNELKNIIEGLKAVPVEGGEK